MPEILSLALAILLPWLAGIACLAGCWRPETPGRWSALIGYGYLLGMAATAALLLGLERLTGGWSYGGVVAVLLLLGAAGVAVNRRRLYPPPIRGASAFAVRAWQGLGTSARVLVVVMAALLAWRLVGLLLEVLWRPVYAWDAWYFWSYRAKAFFAAGHWIDPAWGAEWLRSPEAGYYGGFRHPPLLSMVQLWPALALGRWHESLTLLPWWFAGVALLAAVHGQLRGAGLPASWTLVAVYVLLSLPIVGTHYALGGYADLWIAAFTALAAMSLVAAFRRPEPRQWLLVALALAAITAAKQTGILITLIAAAAIVLAHLPARFGAVLVAGLATVLPVWALTIGIDFNLPMLGRVIIDGDQIRIPRAGHVAWRPLWEAWLQRLLLDGTWHLQFWLAPFVLLAAVPLAWADRAHRGQLVLLLGLFLTIAAVFQFTVQAGVLEDGTGINRQLMPVAVPLVFWAAVVAWDRWTPRAGRRGRSEAAP